MGSCLSKKSACASYSSCSSSVSLPEKPKSETQLGRPETEEECLMGEEIFVIKHRRSHEINRQQSEKPDTEKGQNVIASNGVRGGVATPLRTSSCTKEEIDAILIQCGRLSRSSSTEKAAALSSGNGARKCSGSKRSYDFDGGNGDGAVNGDDDEDAAAREREIRRRERRRQSQGRRRTPSRERELDRSGSRERCGGEGSGGGRRVSKSPRKRSESPIATTNSNSSTAINGNSRPGKMVSVPATDKSNNTDGGGGGGEIKRIQVKRNVGGSPLTRSPARMRDNQNMNVGQNQQQPLPLSLSRSNSRKAEHSPCRRNPLAEIDTNIISQKPNADNNKTVKVSENKNNSTNLTTNVIYKNHQDQHHPIPQEKYGLPTNVALNVISSGPENPKNHQPLTRTRSSRLSRDLDIDPETLSNTNTSSSYNALLLEDIQNFHQKNTSPPAFTLPPCVTKACSILEAVADLNSGTGSSLSSAPFHEQTNKIKRRGASEEAEEQESSGSNSFVTGSGQHHVSSSCWEHDSAESTDRWGSSSSSRPVPRQATCESWRVVADESGRKVSGGKKKRES